MMLTLDDIRTRARSWLTSRFLDAYSGRLLGFGTSYAAPFRVSLGKPDPSWSAWEVRDALDALRLGCGCSLQGQAIPSHARFELRDIPGVSSRSGWPVVGEVVFDTEDDVVAFLGEQQRVGDFASSCDAVLGQVGRFGEPEVRQWLRGHRRQLFANPDPGYWGGIGEVAAYVVAHPASALYGRELPVSVDSKFLERNLVLVWSLFGLFHGTGDGSDCEADMGLRPASDSLVRLRAGDSDGFVVMRGMAVVANSSELIVPGADFSRVAFPGVHRVFVIENKKTYLSFPLDWDEVCIFGSGRAAALLEGNAWLGSVDVRYFGDLDRDGFAILAMFRSMYPQTRSFCMDKPTLGACSAFRVVAGVRGGTKPGDTGSQSSSGDTCPLSGWMSDLTSDERQVLVLLESDIAGRDRLEQEKISLDWIAGQKANSR